MRIIPLSEGQFTVDGSKRFIPFDGSRHHLQERSSGSLLVDIQPFVVVTSTDVLLLDAGLGYTVDGVLQIHQHLAAQGISPAVVTKVLMTHLHKDHSGGLLIPDRAGGNPLSFPNAQIYIQRQELELALSSNTASYPKEQLLPLQQHTQVVLLDGDGTLSGNIRYQMTGAHSPFHQVFWISEGEQQVFFGGDDAPQLQQMRSRFVAKYDYDGRKCMELRRQWWEQGQLEGWTFLFYHDIKTPVFPELSF